MSQLTKQEKLDIVVQMCEKHEITAYEIGQNTGKETSGIQRILNGSTKKPREETLDIILNYINDKLPGEKIIDKSEPIKRDFSADTKYLAQLLQNISKQITEDHEVISKGISETLINTDEIIDISTSYRSEVQRLSELITSRIPKS